MPVKRTFDFLTDWLRGSASVVDPPELQADGTSAVPEDSDTQLQICAEGQVELITAAAGEGSKSSEPPRFRLMAYGGGKMRPSFFYEDVVVDLAGCKVAGGKRPVLMGHNQQRPVGHIESGGVVISPNDIRAEGILSSDNDDSHAIAKSAKHGFPWSCSIGARYDRESVERIEAGQSVQVNGKTLKGPFLLVRKATLYEISFVTIPGDDSARASVTASLTEGTMKFADWLKAKGFDINTLQAAALTTLRAAYQAETGEQAEGDTSQKPKPQTVEAGGGSTAPGGNAGGTASGSNQPPIGGDGASLQASGGQIDQAALLRAEHAKLRRIDSLVASATNVPEEKRNEIHASAMSDNWSTDRVELELLRAGRAEIGSGGEYAIHTPDRQARLSPGVLVASICASLGKISEEHIARGISSEEMDIAATHGYRECSLHALMDRVYIAANGHAYSGTRKSNDFIRAVMRADRQLNAEGYNSLNASSGFTTISLSGILGNVANKLLIAAFESIDTVHQEMCRQANHNDFKVHSRFRLDIDGGYRKVAKDGQLQHSNMSDTGYTAKVDTHGTIMSLTRQDIWDDDLDAFSQIPTQLGNMAPTKMEEEFWKMVLGGIGTFFTVAKKNLLWGADAALSPEGLELARTAFKNRVKKDNTPIGIRPRKLVTGSNQETLGRDLYTQETLVPPGAATKKLFARNQFRGLYEPHDTPYINNTDIRDVDGQAIAGQSDSLYFLLADPMVRAAFVMALLNGRSVPVIESDETDFSTLGMQWRAYHDFGFGFEEEEAVLCVPGIADPG